MRWSYHDLMDLHVSVYSALMTWVVDQNKQSSSLDLDELE